MWTWARLAGGAGVLAVIVVRLGAGPFLDGLRSVSLWSLLAASGIALLTTACNAWRWCLVARGPDVPLRFRTAFAAYYRSQFLNTALPGGILGDVHRGVRHGRDSGHLGRGLRGVVVERAAAQAVQVAVALIVLCFVGSPVRDTVVVVLLAAAICLLVAALVVRAVPRTQRDGSARWMRAGRVVAAELRTLAAPNRWPGVVGTSLIAVAGYTATFLIAARAAGSTASLAELLPLTMLVLLVAAVPVNLGGWGPREGVAAWAFAAAGLGAARGVAAGTTYGVLIAVATLPGAVVLVAGWFGRRQRKAPVTRANLAQRRPEPAGVVDG
jgi:uncharacterized membrane protein YbhN (UPF0104 family)